jgi:hypothetical protein
MLCSDGSKSPISGRDIFAFGIPDVLFQTMGVRYMISAEEFSQVTLLGPL